MIRNAKEKGRSIKKSVRIWFDTTRSPATQPPIIPPTKLPRGDEVSTNHAFASSNSASLAIEERGAVIDPPKRTIRLQSSSRLNNPTGNKVAFADYDIRQRAFRQALEQREKNEMELLVMDDHNSISDLFKDMRNNIENESTSPWFKGLERLGTTLKVSKLVLDLTDPISNFHPAAAGPIAVVKVVVSVGISLCGAVPNMQGKISDLILDLKYIDLCDDIHGYEESLVQKALVTVYHHLFDFYLRTTHVFKKGKPLLSWGRSVWDELTGEIDGIISSLGQDAQRLKDLVNLDTNAIARREQCDKMIRSLLKCDAKVQNAENDFINELNIRADEACSWITETSTLHYWSQDTPDSGLKMIALYGPIGIGKTYTTGYVEQWLRSGPNAAARVVCSYYCRDGGSTNKAGSVYRGLLWQILITRTSLKLHFQDWVKETPRGMTDVTQDNDELRKYLIDLLSGPSLCTSTFIIIDGIDECNDDSRRELSSFLKQLRARAPDVRVFISARDTDLFQDTVAIEAYSSQQRDECIIRHHLNRCISGAETKKEVIDFVVGELSTKIQGSAIWARMAAESLKNINTTERAVIRNEIENLPLPDKLPELYKRIFRQTTEASSKDRELLTLSLELMAAMHTRLSLRDLSHAVDLAIGSSKRKPRTIEDMDKSTDWGRIWKLLRPFVTSVGQEVTIDTQPKLVHKSLQDAIQEERPRDWASKDSQTYTKQPVQSSQLGLDALALQVCINYMQLDDFCKEKVRSNNVGRDPGERFLLSICPPSPAEASHGDQLLESSETDDCDLYTYAACNWDTHLRVAPAALVPNLDGLIEITRRGSVQFENWLTRRNRFEDIDYATRIFDPLFMAVCYSDETAIAECLNRLSADESWMEEGEERTEIIWQIANRAIHMEQLQVVKMFLIHPTMKPTLESWTLFGLISSRLTQGIDHNKYDDWHHLLNVIFTKFEDVVVEDGGLILLHACRVGCLSVVERLFLVAQRNPTLGKRLALARTCLYQTNDKRCGAVGIAAFYAHADVLEYLLEQEDMLGQVYEEYSADENIYHLVTAHATAEIVKVLLRKYPEGATKSNGEFTPFQCYVDGNQIQSARVLLEAGKANVDPGNHLWSPLRYAIRGGGADMCRMLVLEAGMDPMTVLEEDQDGRLHLTESSVNRSPERDAELLELLTSLIEEKKALAAQSFADALREEGEMHVNGSLLELWSTLSGSLWFWSALLLLLIAMYSSLVSMVP